MCVDDVSYGQDGVVAVKVSFPGPGPSLTCLVRRLGENDCRLEEPPFGLDPKRDLAEQLLGRRVDSFTVTGATGSRGTKADGAAVYNLELRLRPLHPDQAPETLRSLKWFTSSYARYSGVKVSMRVSQD